jgi:hypothetical protein
MRSLTTKNNDLFVLAIFRYVGFRLQKINK